MNDKINNILDTMLEILESERISGIIDFLFESLMFSTMWVVDVIVLPLSEIITGYGVSLLFVLILIIINSFIKNRKVNHDKHNKEMETGDEGDSVDFLASRLRRMG